MNKINEIKLYQHQKKALEQTKNFNKVAYYLDMGLGKTFVGSEKLKLLNNNINLVICQKSKLNDWINHFKTFYNNYTILDLSNKNGFISFMSSTDNNIIGVINYDLVWRRKELMKLKNFTLMLDESSLIKNSTAKRTKFITKKLKYKNLILLSGTPIGGKYEEIWTQCILLGWNITKQQFYDDYTIYITNNYGGIPIKEIIGYKNIDNLKAKLKTLGCIFMKFEDAMKLQNNSIKMPKQKEIVMKCKSTSNYKKFNKDRVIELDENTKLIGDNPLTKMLYLRQLSNTYNPNRLQQIKDLLESTNDRLIIFYNFNNELKQLKELVTKLKKPLSIINGAEKDLSNYEKYNDSVTLIQYKAGAHGLNLQKANKIIYASLPLESEIFEQSKKRTHRIGQNRTCFYYILLTEKTIDEKIYKVLQQRNNYTLELFKNDM